jgi:hypothetical protein
VSGAAKEAAMPPDRPWQWLISRSENSCLTTREGAEDVRNASAPSLVSVAVHQMKSAVEASAGFAMFIFHPGVCCDPIYFPSLAAII